MKILYTPEKCITCGQTTTYALALDRGTTDIVRAISVAIQRKRINAIHPRKEMEAKFPDPLKGTLSSNQVGNLSRARMHGLIAKIKGNPGNYCLTTKGSRFLKGQEVPRVAIMNKVSGRQQGYLEAAGMCTIRDFLSENETWEGVNYDIVEGRIIFPTLL